MLRSIAIAGAAGLVLAGCQSADPRYYYTDQDCLNRQVSSRVLSLAAGVGLGLVGVPGGGLVVGLATDPRCQAYHLTPEGRARIAREIELERRERARLGYPVDERGRIRPTVMPDPVRPFDNVPSSAGAPPPAN
jgi:hypothetical protein